MLLRSKPSLLTFVSHLSKEAIKYTKVERVGEKKNVGLIALDRPRAFNQLSIELMAEVADGIRSFDKDDEIGAIILTSTSKKLFTAGADIRQMLAEDFFGISGGTFLTNWNVFEKTSKPLIAAVNGYVFGGGCEISMACDIIIAADNSLFSLPEIKIGTIPGSGGTQRLIRAVGKSLAMEMILTGDRITAEEALQAKLISKVVPYDELRNEAIKLGEKIANQSQAMTKRVKESVNRSFENTLKMGANYERQVFWSTFTTEDRKAGMGNFPKTPDKWQNK